MLSRGYRHDAPSPTEDRRNLLARLSYHITYQETISGRLASQVVRDHPSKRPFNSIKTTTVLTALDVHHLLRIKDIDKLSLCKISHKLDRSAKSKRQKRAAEAAIVAFLKQSSPRYAREIPKSLGLAKGINRIPPKSPGNAILASFLLLNILISKDAIGVF